MSVALREIIQNGKKGGTGDEKGQAGSKASGDAVGRRGDVGGAKGRGDQSRTRAAGRRAAKAKSAGRWTRARHPAQRPIQPGAGMQAAHARRVLPDLVQWTFQVSLPIAGYVLRVAEDMLPKVESE